MSLDHSSLVAMFKEKLRPKYYVKSGYIKENVYFNGIALKESLLHDNEYAEAPNRILFNHKNKSTYPNKSYEMEKGCFIYQNPTSYHDDNCIQNFTDTSLINELGTNMNCTYSLDNEIFKMVKKFINFI